MTKIPVNVPGFSANMLYGATKVQSTDATGEFGKIFENQKNAASEIDNHEDAFEPQDDVVKEVDNKEVTTEVNDQKEQTTVKEPAETQSGKDASDDAQGELSDEEMNQAAEVLNNAVASIQNALMQELGINQEELNALLESMGLDDMDLLNQGTLKDILLQVNGLDMTALLTNEELYGQIQNLEGAFSEVMAEAQDALQMTDEELNALKEQLANMNKEPVITIETEGVSAATQKENPADEQGFQNNAFAAPNQNLTNMQTVLEQANATQSTTATFMSAQAESIMNQVMDYMRIQLNAETSTLEMQLQPENLGTLQIRISAKEGIMTAQFTTASESVKAALEGQLVQLQQQFENQNIKVEAIEITVQTHQFESALEQGNERQQTEEDSKKNRVRKIDLNQLEEVEEIPEEDRIVAEMMAASGSTVDYLA